jgi:hypothetical protein
MGEDIVDADDTEGDDDFMPYEVRANAKLLAQTISAADFEIGVEPGNVVKLGDTIKIVSNEAPKKSRKRKG